MRASVCVCVVSCKATDHIRRHCKSPKVTLSASVAEYCPRWTLFAGGVFVDCWRLKVQSYQNLHLGTNFIQCSSQHSFKSHMWNQCDWVIVQWYSVELFSYQGSESDQLVKAGNACYHCTFRGFAANPAGISFQRYINMSCLIFFARRDKTLL